MAIAKRNPDGGSTEESQREMDRDASEAAGHSVEALAYAADPARVAALRDLELLDTPPEPAFDRITALAREIYDVPIALVSLVDAERQWFKSCIGVTASETDLDRSFCARAILSQEPLVVCDATLDARFARNPAVTGEPYVRFYAGIPLKAGDGGRIGTLCIIDTTSREIDEADLSKLKALAEVTEAVIQMRLHAVRGKKRAVELRRLATVVETSQDAIITKSVDGTITGWNKGAEQIYGYRREEVVGKSISILVPPDMPNDVPAVLARVTAGERIDHYQTKRQTKSGTVLDVSLSVSPIHDDAGDIVGAAVIARDITDARRLQAAAEEQAEMLDLAEDAIMARDLSGVITYWNKASERYYGWSKKDAFGHVSHDLLQTVFPLPLEDLQQELLREGRWEGEVTQRTRHGREVIAASRWTLRRDQAGDAFQVLEVNNDITARKAAEEDLRLAREEAERANLSKTEFLSRMSHELRTPLNAILGFAQLLALDDLTADQSESTEQIIKGGRRLLDLINEVLDIARIESGQFAISLEPVPAVASVRGSVELIRPLADQRSIALSVDVSIDGDCHVIADRQRLDQVLLNLLSNAVKYNVENGNIAVALSRPSDEVVRITVQDSGPGIAPEDLPRLFVPFDRLGAEQKGVEGTGLGLPLVKSLLEAMGGEVAVESHRGRGTTFVVELRAAGPPKTAKPHLRRSESSAPSSHLVLSIEDNLSNRRLLERVLEAQRPEMQLIAAMTGTLGVDLARDHMPDLILLDLHLPDLEGEQVLAQLRKDPRTAAIPVVILSADATPNRIDRLLAAGAEDYVAKPIDVARLMGVLDRLLGAGEARE